MSREIKFRAWDKDSKRYGEVVEIEYNESREIDGIWVWYNIHERYEPIPGANVTVEQYTGLKDKNGKEIYEGDIVALLFGYVPMKSVTTENIRIENAQKAVIHFDTARAAFRYTIKLRTPKDCQFKPGTKTNMVVIGNIHENPELLGGEE